jgi:cytochrome b pre-mRNA-processing protein 6
VLARRLEQGRHLAPATARRGAAATQEQADLRQANALCSLLENRYQNKVGAIRDRGEGV